MANRNQLTLIDGSTRYPFTIFRDKEQGGVSITSKEWEPGDPASYWKIPLHPWDGGLGTDKIQNPRSYIDANADLTNKDLLVPPPLLATPTITAGVRDSVDGNGTAATGVTLDLSTIGVDVVPGDIVCIYIATTDADAVTLTNSVGGMEALAQVTNGTHSGRFWYLSYQLGASDSYTFTFGATVDVYVYSVFTLKNVLPWFLGQTTVLDASNSGSDSTSPYTTSVTTTVNESIVIGITSNISGTAYTDVPSGWTSLHNETVTNVSSAALRSAYKVQTTAGAISGDFTHGSNVDGVVFCVAFFRVSLGSFSGTKSRGINWDNSLWFFKSVSNLTGSTLYSASFNTVTVRAHFNDDMTGMELFNDELILGFGYAVKICKVTVTTYAITQATDNTYAGVLAVVGKNLWRSTATNAVSSCTTTPLTLSSWGTSYTVGESTEDINSLIDYAGSVWVGKEDGVYAPDINSNFWNQTPQIKAHPDPDNCDVMFTAKGYLWCATIDGLLRITIGESVIRGPEVTKAPNYSYSVEAGFEWDGDIWLLVNPNGSNYSNQYSYIIRMIENRSGSDNEYIYHIFIRFPTSGKYVHNMAMNLTSQPIVYVIGPGTGIDQLQYFILGYGGGRRIDDSGYSYGLSWFLEIGAIKPNDDMSLVNGLLGVTLVTDQDSSETIDTIQYKIENGSYTNMLDTQEGGGSMPITNTSGYAAVTRYAASGALGQFFGFYFAGSMSDAHAGTDRPEVREIWAFGYTRPRVTDLVKVAIYGDSRAIAGSGIPQGRGPGEVARLFKAWKRDQTVLQFEMADYEASRTVRVRVADVEDLELLAAIGTTGDDERVPNVMVTFIRDDMAGAIYNA